MWGRGGEGEEIMNDDALRQSIEEKERAYSHWGWGGGWVVRCEKKSLGLDNLSLKCCGTSR